MSTKANVEETTLEPEVAEQPADSTVLAESESGDLTFSDADEDLDSEDSLTFSNGVIEKIVAISVRDVPGVLGMKGGFINRVQETFGAADPTKGVSVEVMPDSSVRVNISVLIEYGAYAPQVFEDVKKVVVKQVAGMTGLEVGGVNLRIEDVLTADEYERMKGARDEAESEQEEE
ncbi:Asp23/Gls24 family envelope stress response protein [uncultured Parolsenella sp.]|uniref:Asp23/Gls24 family envelope stress response protein n=1 Tax=uncultured Parolsenella sp. TaxID=2083008 RepID=UPI0025EA619C|nr:Asp23/Gls24 family envelope stress response protein [uncultured Parolsenella sp.]